MCIELAKARRNELTLKEKINLIDASRTQSQRQLADQFNVCKSQVQRILKRKAEFMEAFEQNQRSDKKVFLLAQTQVMSKLMPLHGVGSTMLGH